MCFTCVSLSVCPWLSSPVFLPWCSTGPCLSLSDHCLLFQFGFCCLFFQLLFFPFSLHGVQLFQVCCFKFFFFICYDFVLCLPCQFFFLFKCPNLFWIVYLYGLVLLFKINKNCFRQKPELSAFWVPRPHCHHHTPHGNFVVMSGLVALWKSKLLLVNYFQLFTSFATF